MGAIHADRPRAARQTDGRRVPLTRSERRVKVEAAKLRETLDRRLGRETPDWVLKLAREKV